MSALAWLFGLGALAIAFPFVFHLIRQTPKGQTEFSSLMFLRPSPPRLTRRSKLENWLLLLLRCAAILLVALAFTRPFFRNGSQIPLANIPGRNVAILIDTSASMKRGELWSDAQDQVKELVSGLRANDRVGLFAFDSQLNSIVDFDQSGAGNNADAVRTKVMNLAPSWHPSNPGVAIAAVADRLTRQNDADQTQTSGQIYLVTDFQKSSKLDALQSIQWPDNVKLQVVPIESEINNASIQILKNHSDEDSGRDDTARIRIRNQPSSTSDQFQIRWDIDDTSQPTHPAQYVAPGSSRVVNVPFSTQPSQSIVLQGDDCEFDNRFYLIQPQQHLNRVLYLGDQKDDNPEELRYYFQRALPETPLTKTEVRSEAELQGEEPDMAIVTDPVNDEQADRINELLAAGKWVVLIASDQQRVESFAPWLGGRMANTPSRVEEYHLLVDLDFTHPLFAPFDSPRFNDFTRIKFWQHAVLELDEPETNRVIARFDDDSPAVWTRSVNGGHVLAMSFGWRPSQSQLALSSKFLPMMHEIVNLGMDRPAPVEGCVVGQPVTLDFAKDTVEITDPSGKNYAMSATDQTFRETHLPGIYNITQEGNLIQQFAANVDPLESDSNDMSVEQLEALGVILGEQATAEEKAEQMRAMKDSQLEDQQKIWKWAIVFALGLILAETFLGARRPATQSTSENLEAVA